MMATAVAGHMPFFGHRTCAEAPEPPPGCSEIPAEMLWESVAGTLGIEKPDHDVREFRTAMILVGASCTEPTPSNLARWSGYGEKACRHVISTMTRNGIWVNGQPNHERYVEGHHKPGLQMGDIALVLDTLLCLGEIRCKHGGELWFHADVPLAREQGRIEQFADHLADGMSVKEAARLVGASPTYGNAMLQRIRRKLGAQAV